MSSLQFSPEAEARETAGEAGRISSKQLGIRPFFPTLSELARSKTDFRTSTGFQPPPRHANDSVCGLGNWASVSLPVEASSHVEASSLYSKGCLTDSTPAPLNAHLDSAYNCPFSNLGFPICTVGWGSDLPPQHPR